MSKARIDTGIRRKKRWLEVTRTLRKRATQDQSVLLDRVQITEHASFRNETLMALTRPWLY